MNSMYLLPTYRYYEHQNSYCKKYYCKFNFNSFCFVHSNQSSFTVINCVYYNIIVDYLLLLVRYEINVKEQKVPF